MVLRAKAGVGFGRKRQHEPRNEGPLLARKIHVQLIDDLSGEDAQETIRFSVEGTDYEIDLSAHNAADLRGTVRR